MSRTATIHGLLFLIGLLVCIGTASAAINSIEAGDTVFIGESGLDITLGMCGDREIGWFASAADYSSGFPPTLTVSVSDPADFAVSPSNFVGYTGNWYTLPNRTLAFNVSDPHIDLRILDTTTGGDVTNGESDSGDEIEFMIYNNYIPMTSRDLVTSVPITLHVQSMDGTEYTSLVDSDGAATSIVDIPVTDYAQVTGPIWNTAGYPAGIYRIWAVCNVNHMNDNYGYSGGTGYPGKTYTTPATLLIRRPSTVVTLSTIDVNETPTSIHDITERPTVTRPPTAVPTLTVHTLPSMERTPATASAMVMTTATTAPAVTNDQSSKSVDDPANEMNWQQEEQGNGQEEPDDVVSQILNSIKQFFGWG